MTNAITKDTVTTLTTKINDLEERIKDLEEKAFKRKRVLKRPL